MKDIKYFLTESDENKKPVNKFIVVAFYNGKPMFLQMRGELNWYFYNNHTKVFKRLKSAIQAANKVEFYWKVDVVKVYDVTDVETANIDDINRWEKYEKERIKYSIDGKNV